MVKIVYDELVSLLGEKNNDVNLNAVPPVPIVKNESSAEYVFPTKLTITNNVTANFLSKFFFLIIKLLLKLEETHFLNLIFLFVL